MPKKSLNSWTVNNSMKKLAKGNHSSLLLAPFGTSQKNCWQEMVFEETGRDFRVDFQKTSLEFLTKSLSLRMRFIATAIKTLELDFCS
jgi:hypothetical protein